MKKINNVKKKFKIFKIIIPLVILVVLIVVFATNMKQEVTDKFSLARYIIFTVDGVDSRGEATVDIDEVGIYRALSQDNNTSYYKAFVDTLTVTADKTENLSNGDEVTVTVSYDETIAQKLGVEVAANEKIIKISGLKQGEKINLFSDVKIITGGVSPYVYAICSYEPDNTADEYISSLEYRINKSSNLAIGDEIEIVCKTDEKTAADNGYYYDVNVMKYVITRADKYVDSMEELNKLDEKILKEQDDINIQVIKDEIADTTYRMAYKVTGKTEYLYRDNNEEAVSFEKEQVVLAVNSGGMKKEHENYILVFYKGYIALPKYTTETDPYDYVETVFCFMYSDAIVTMDGEFLMATNEPNNRYICAKNMEEVMGNIEEKIGKEYVFHELN